MSKPRIYDVITN